MTNIILAILTLFALISIIDRPFAGLAIVGVLALLATVFRKMSLLVKRVGSLETMLETLSEKLAEEIRVNEVADNIAVNEDTSTTRVQAPRSVLRTQPDRAHSSASDYIVKDSAPHSSNADPSTVDQIEPKSQLDQFNDASFPDSIAARETRPEVAYTQTESTLDQSSSESTQKPQPVEARTPNIFDETVKKVIDAGIGWITGGNIFVRVGVVILFMGMTFLIRYAVVEGFISIELRLAGVAAVAIALLVWGWKQRNKRSNFALVVQGGGIGLLYLTIFASFSMYKIIDSVPAFVLLAFVVIFAAILSVLQNSKSLALFATVGGFLAPILTSSGSNNYIGLFSYYTALNLGIFAIAWFKSWRILNFTGFVFTFAISGVWGVLSYEPEFFGTTQPFLIVFFLLYVGIAILFALRRAPNFKDTIDSSLVFGTPLLAFVMQYELVGDTEYGVALSAFSLAAFYLVTAYFLWQRYSTKLTLLCETFLSLSVIFATLAIPFAIDGSLTGPVWAIEGAGILWVSIRQQQLYRRFFAIALMFASGVIMAWEIGINGSSLFSEKLAFLNSTFIGATLIAISTLVGSWLLDAEFEGKRSVERLLGYSLIAYSSLVLLIGFEVQIIQFNKFDSHGHLLATLSIIMGLLLTHWGAKLNWKMANWIALGYFALLIPAAILSMAWQDRLAENMGYLIWPLAMLSLFYSLRMIRVVIPYLISLSVHGAGAVLLAALLVWEGLWQLLAGFSLATIMFSWLGDRMNWREFRLSGVLFLPILVICFLTSTYIDGDLVTLSSIGSDFYPPFKPGSVLWSFAFAVYFYLLLKNTIFEERFQIVFYYAGAFLIAVMLLWLGLWPLLLGATVLCWLAYYLAIRNSWPEMRKLSLLLLPIMVIVPLLTVLNGVSDPINLIAFNLDFHFIAQSGAVLWPFAFVTFYLMAWLSGKEALSYSDFFHSIALMLMVIITTWEISQIALHRFQFFDAGHLIFLPIISFIAIRSILSAKHWPFSIYQEGFRQYALMPLLSAIIAWSLIQFGSSGSGVAIPWIPLINPIDLMQLIIIIGLFIKRDQILVGKFERFQKYVLVGFAIYGFMWINVDILRVVHHWSDIEWRFLPLIQANITQTLLSLVWSLIGLAGAFYATRKLHRQLWIAAAALLGIVVLKLLLIDLSAQDTFERIISFTGVGVLLTFVGYFSPIPPGNEVSEEDDKEQVA